jgi:uncharacterized protein (TIGR04540 family)
MEFLKHPKAVKELAAEIKSAADAYWGREITEKELREIVIHWATHENRMLFHGADLNSTVKKIIGIKRTELVNKMLEGTQLHF